MAPVHTMNGEPIAWHVLREIGIPGDSYDLCRCGRSADKPFCDGSHARAPWMDAETADRAPMEMRAGRSGGADAVLLDDETLCAHAGFCGTRTTNVWELIEEGSPEARERAKGMVWMCPSGRLRYDAPPGSPAEPDVAAEIAVVPGGPLWVRGGIHVVSADGTPWPAQERRTLCRCGASTNKPFCDGRHAEIGFDER